MEMTVAAVTMTAATTAVTAASMTTTATAASDVRPVFAARHDYTAAVPTMAPKKGQPLSLRPM